jgi:parallel beta-helix repeat protein
MKMQTKKKIGTQMLLFSIICSGMLCVSNNFAIASENNYNAKNTELPVSSGAPTGNHAPIRLDSNTALENYVLGNTTLGTKASPHVMSNLIIVAGTAVHALNLTSITLFLVFRNCTFIDVAGSASVVMLKLVQNLKIENCTIMLSSSTMGITIDSCSHIIIDDCVLTGLESGIYSVDSDNIEILNSRITNTHFSPIYFVRTDVSLIENCLVYVSFHSFLIELIDSENITIQDSELLNGEVCIVANVAPFLSILNCHISNATREGVRIVDMSNGSIIGNVFYNCSLYGLNIWSNFIDSVIYHNAFIDNHWGSVCSETGASSIENTYDDGEFGNYYSDYDPTIYNPDAINVNGIWDTPFEINNTGACAIPQQDNFPLSYTQWRIITKAPHVGKINIDGDAALNEFCLGQGTLGTKENPHIIEDYVIDAEGIGSPIKLKNISLHLIIRNCTLYNCGDTFLLAGIYADHIGNLTITNCTIINNPRSSIVVDECSNITIENNTIYDNGGGIELTYFENLMIKTNTIYKIQYGGIYISDGINATVWNNDVREIENTGIWVDDLKNSTIQNNRVINCGQSFHMRQFVTGTKFVNVLYNHFNTSYIDNAIELSGIENCTFMGNIVFNSTYFGLNFYGDSYNNTFYYNAFVNNGWGSTKVQYAGVVMRNFFDNGSVGNFWSDYESQYPNAIAVNGRWNTPYDINYTEPYNDDPIPNQQDNFPLTSFGTHGNFKPSNPATPQTIPNFGITIFIEFLFFVGVITCVVIYMRYRVEITGFINSKRR